MIFLGPACFITQPPFVDKLAFLWQPFLFFLQSNSDPAFGLLEMKVRLGLPSLFRTSFKNEFLRWLLVLLCGKPKGRSAAHRLIFLFNPPISSWCTRRLSYWKIRLARFLVDGFLTRKQVEFYDRNKISLPPFRWIVFRCQLWSSVGVQTNR